MLCSLLIIVLVICGFRKKIFGVNMEVPIISLLSIWWMATAITLTSHDKKADNALQPKNSWREAVIILAWIEMGLWSMHLIMDLSTLIMTRCSSKRIKPRSHRSFEAEPESPPVKATAPPTPDVWSQRHHSPSPQFKMNRV